MSDGAPSSGAPSSAAAQTQTPNRFRVYGCDVESDFLPSHNLSAALGPPRLSIREAKDRLTSEQLGEPVYVSPESAPNGDSALIAYHSADGLRLRLPTVGDYLLDSDEILYRWQNPELGELNLLGPVSAVWLETIGTLALHASAVVAGGRAIAFLSIQGSGKSVLAASFVSAGAKLLSDDILALDETEEGWFGQPGYPQMRLWPDEAAHFVGDIEHLETVSSQIEKRRVPIGTGLFGDFHIEAAPLAALFVPERDESAEAPRTEPLSSRDAVVELVRHSFAARIADAMGMQPDRIERLARLVEAVPVRRLVYPSGFENLAATRAAIENALREIGGHNTQFA